jgi:hypothetical protein
MAKKNEEMSTRQREGLVEEDYERQLPDDEVIAAGEAIDAEFLDEVGDVILAQPSQLGNPYMSPEEQDMDMQPQVMGPPQYGSPDPATSAGRLLPLTTHPLQAHLLPEGHPAAISEDYGNDVAGYTHPATATSHPLQSESDLDTDLQGRRDAREGNYEEMTKADLKDEADARGLEGLSGANKSEIIEALEADDEAASQGTDSE